MCDALKKVARSFTGVDFPVRVEELGDKIDKDYRYPPGLSGRKAAEALDTDGDQWVTKEEFQKSEGLVKKIGDPSLVDRAVTGVELAGMGVVAAAFVTFLAPQVVAVSGVMLACECAGAGVGLLKKL